MPTNARPRSNPARYGATALLCLLLLACGAGSRLPTQVWQDVTVGLETRPAPVVAGMNEFLVSAVRPTGAAEYNLLVFIRMDDDQPWVQAIQDGHTGVFRRAIAVRGDAPHTLRVRLVRAGQEGALAFELPPPGVP
ncbi:MAG: hypothetical protein Q8L89_04860 [Gammaproteobacteria bacterium]|nr:hypothetical protein [Gammaproteobacteria bacterium]